MEYFKKGSFRKYKYPDTCLEETSSEKIFHKTIIQNEKDKN